MVAIPDAFSDNKMKRNFILRFVMETVLPTPVLPVKMWLMPAPRSAVCFGEAPTRRLKAVMNSLDCD
jgi:hypothetical protein